MLIVAIILWDLQLFNNIVQLNHRGRVSERPLCLKSKYIIIYIVLDYSTVTDFAKLRGWSTSVPFKTAT
jgi:hypothetical protein